MSVSTQLEPVRLNGKCTIQFVESLVDLVSNLSKEITYLKNDNVLLKQEMKNLYSIIEDSPGSLCLRKCPARTLPVSNVCLQLIFPLGPCLLFLYLFLDPVPFS
jgi:hypothetical protein